MISLPEGQPADDARLQLLRGSLGQYAAARARLLGVLDLAASNRDPLAEFSEHLVQALLGGKMADSRVQPGYDLTRPSGERIQVRYLANHGTCKWVNEHHVRSGPGFEKYALVLYESFDPRCVLVFPSDLAAIGAELGKSHPAQDRNLQFTRANYVMIRDDPGRFRRLGMQVWLAPFRKARAS